MSNFAFLLVHDEQLVRLGILAERYFPEDPNTAMLKLRQFAELLAQLVAAKVGSYTSPSEGESQYELHRRLRDRGVMPREIADHFDGVRRAGNSANHALVNDHRGALDGLRTSWQLGVWFHRTFADLSFRPGPFIPPSPPGCGGDELRGELERLAQELREYRAANMEVLQRLASAEVRLAQTMDNKSFWEEMAAGAEGARAVTCPPRRAQHHPHGRGLLRGPHRSAAVFIHDMRALRVRRWHFAHA